MINYLTSNSKNVFYVGDIHGHYSNLMTELDRLNFDDSNDIVISTGDLIDRGPESLQTLSLIEKPWFKPVIANHELLAIHSKQFNFDGPTHAQWLSNGGIWFESLSSKDKNYAIQLLDELIFKCRPFIELSLEDTQQKVAIIHAGIPKGFTWSDVRSSKLDNESLHQFINLRVSSIHHVNVAFEMEPSEVDLVVVGHNVMNTNIPQCVGKMVFADTGSGKNGALTVHRHSDIMNLVNLNESIFALRR